MNPVPSGAAPGGQSRRRTAPTARRKGHGRYHRVPCPSRPGQTGRGAPAAHSHLGSPATRCTAAGGRRRRDTAPGAPARAAAASPAGAARTTPAPPPLPPPGHRGPGVFAPRCPTLPYPSLPCPARPRGPGHVLPRCSPGGAGQLSRRTSACPEERVSPLPSACPHRRAPRYSCPRLYPGRHQRAERVLTPIPAELAGKPLAEPSPALSLPEARTHTGKPLDCGKYRLTARQKRLGPAPRQVLFSPSHNIEWNKMNVSLQTGAVNLLVDRARDCS